MAIVGRPNVGKSTLLNRMLGEKIAIVTSKPQTTRTRILGIIHSERYQIVFVDTPGIHDPKCTLDKALVRNAFRAVRDCDVIVYVCDATKLKLIQLDWGILSGIHKRNKAPIVVALNKIDLNSRINLEEIELVFTTLLKPKLILPISALTGENVSLLLENIVQNLTAGPPFYDEDVITDQKPFETAAETIREKVIVSFRQEVPYQTAVEITLMEPKKDNPKILHIQADIIVSSPGQKAMVIGKGGEKVKAIGTAARKELKEVFDTKIFLELWVKVRPNWFKKDLYIKKFGYDR